MKKNLLYAGALIATLLCVTNCSDGDDGDSSGTIVWDGVTTSGTVDASLADNQVVVVWGDSTIVHFSSNLDGLMTTAVRGGNVTLLADASLTEEVTYTLSGVSTNGSLYMDGKYKATFVLNGLTLSSADSAAINIRDGKRIAIQLAEGTANVLSDKSGGSHKACLMVKGHTEFSGGGSLTLTGNTGHAFWSKEYAQLKASTGTITVTSAVGDGFNVNQYFEMNGGIVSIGSVGDDGIQVSYETDDDGNIEDDEENTGEVLIQGGSLTISTTAAGSKGVKAEGPVTVNSGKSTPVVTIQNSGGVDASDSSDLVGSACLKSESAITIDAGTLNLTNTGQGGRAILCDGTLTVNGGSITAQATGSNYGSSSGNQGGFGRTGGSSGNHKYAKGVKVDGAFSITGGALSVASSNHEGLESESTMSFAGGVTYVKASDDAINSASHLTISDGYVCAYSTGNDGLDSNGNCYIQGGTVYAIGATSPEVAVDANTEGGYKLYVQGGTLVAIGGLESGSSLSQSCYQASSWSKSTWYALYAGSVVGLAFKTPASGGTPLVVSTSGTASLKSGVTVSGGTSLFDGLAAVGATVGGGSSVSLSSYSGGNQGGRW